MWAALDLDLGHHPVRDQAGDDSDESVSRRTPDGQWVGGGCGVLAGELRQHAAGYDQTARGIPLGGEAAAVDPPSHGVIADAQQPGGVPDPDQ